MPKNSNTHKSGGGHELVKEMEFRSSAMQTGCSIRFFASDSCFRSYLRLPLPNRRCSPLASFIVSDLRKSHRFRVLKVSSMSRSLRRVFNRKFSQLQRAFVGKKFRSVVLLNIITIVYASNIPMLKEVEGSINTTEFNAVRFITAAVPFIPFVLQARDDSETRNAGLELGFWVSLGYITQALGLLSSDAGRASFLSMFTVIIVPLLDGMLGAVVPARTWFGALMSIIGVVFLESSGSPPCIGDLFTFLSAVFFGVHILRTEHISKTSKHNKLLPLLGYEVCSVAFLSTLLYLSETFAGANPSNATPWTWLSTWNWVVSFPWIPAIYTGIISVGICMWLEILAMREVTATETAVIYGLEPLWGAGFAWVLLGERWGMSGWIGAALVLIGSLSSQMLESPPHSGEECGRKHFEEYLISHNEKNAYSVSPIPVNPRKSRVSGKLLR